MAAPIAFDDAVVGGGILGIAHAYHLARRGRRVVVIERNPRAMGASVRNFGMLWPIGQRPGAMRQMAMRSLDIWIEALEESGCWFERSGSLHLAYHEDEAMVLSEFANSGASDGLACVLESPSDIGVRSDAVQQTSLVAGLWSPTETCIDPRQVTARIPEWLQSEFGVEFRYGQAVTSYTEPYVRAGEHTYEVDHLWVCSGDELHLLYPDVLQALGLVRCKLQMMRSLPVEDGWRMGPMLAAGLTLRHYSAFEACPSLPAVKQRILEETPMYDAYGIHVMASQNGLGEIVIGDSHEYGQSIGPFDKVEIDSMILRYLASFLKAPDLHVAERWHGTYAKHPSLPYVVVNPELTSTLITGVGGAGMTLSFGLAEQTVNAVLGSV